MDPLVSCVMPTWDRRDFLPAAVDCWNRQTYKRRELIIVEEECDHDPIIGWGITYWTLKKKVTTGEKRNICNELASGEVICHFDDDDWSDPRRIEHQVRILQSTGRPVTGYGTLLFWDVGNQWARIYRAKMPGYVCGTSFCYLKSFWSTHKFQNQQIASDNKWIYPVVRQVAACPEHRLMVARIHDRHHTSAKRNIREAVDRSAIPDGFWENESLRKGIIRENRDLGHDISKTGILAPVPSANR